MVMAKSHAPLLSVYRALLRIARSSSLLKLHWRETSRFPVPLSLNSFEKSSNVKSLPRIAAMTSTTTNELLASTLDAYQTQVLQTHTGLHSSKDVESCIKWCFRYGHDENDESKHNKIVKRLDGGLAALRRLVEYKSELTELADERGLHKHQRAQLRFGVGEIVKLAGDGSRAVVIGWERHCDTVLDEDEVDELEHGGEQALYFLLKDKGSGDTFEVDENVERVQDEAEKAEIDHADAQFVFDRFDDALKRYVPIDMIRYIYPDVYHVNDAAASSPDVCVA